ncbi:hypothetical protein HDU97_009724 [Phlyctochytrium planicorne]|nr:hypothetical protein HDU97_009724 [Phlyctochytrium planicorne]
MDFRAVDEKYLRRYKRVLKLRSPKPVLSKEDLVQVVTKHFNSQEINEKEVITYFIYSVRNQGNLLTETTSHTHQVLSSSSPRPNLHNKRIFSPNFAEIMALRLRQLLTALSSHHEEDSCLVDENQCSKSKGTLRIGDITLALAIPERWELVPTVTSPFFDKSQVQNLSQIRPPGNLRLRLILKYAELAQREVEYISLTKDTMESDLKQRREIYDATSSYCDGPCVRAAVYGRILILDGVERAERNVMPILNNLLENREMLLEDGRFLVNPERFDLLQKNTSSDEFSKMKVSHEENQVFNLITKLIKTSSRFLVVALGLPVPTIFNEDYGGASPPDFTSDLDKIGELLQTFPGLPERIIIDLIYPFTLFPTIESGTKEIIESLLKRFGFSESLFDSSDFIANFDIGKTAALASEAKAFQKEITFSFVYNGQKNSYTSKLWAGNTQTPVTERHFFVETKYQRNVLFLLLVAHSVGDFCIIGDKGGGKSTIVRYFARLLGYRCHYFPLYAEMSARDLLQRRATNQRGDTIWIDSAIITAALLGDVVVLDQLEVLSFGVISTIQRLVTERELTLPDGRQMMPRSKYVSLLKAGLVKPSTEILPIHPSFRIVAIARLTSTINPRWLTPEIVSTFRFIYLRPLTYFEEREIAQALSPNLRGEQTEISQTLAEAFSIRQILRISRHLSQFPEASVYNSIVKATLGPFLPQLAREVLDRILKTCNILPPQVNLKDTKYTYEEINQVKLLRIGDVLFPVATNTNPLLVPKTKFFDNEEQLRVMEELLKDFLLGERILLIGNQGVGKNKIVDRLLELLELPREYIQLHRDTTVYSLTLMPTIKDGVLIYDDSPLIRAAKLGYTLVIDEADKAPTHVVSIIKDFIENGEMALFDGRQIVPAHYTGGRDCSSDVER